MKRLKKLSCMYVTDPMSSPTKSLDNFSDDRSLNIIMIEKCYLIIISLLLTTQKSSINVYLLHIWFILIYQLGLNILIYILYSVS